MRPLFHLLGAAALLNLTLIAGASSNAQEIQGEGARSLAILLDSEPRYITVYLDSGGRTARPNRNNPDSLPPADDIAIALGLCGATIADAGRATGSCDFGTQPASAAAGRRQAGVVARAKVHVTRQDGGAFSAVVVDPQSGPGNVRAAEPDVIRMIADGGRADAPCWTTACIASLTAPPNPRDPRAANPRAQAPMATRNRTRFSTGFKLTGDGGQLLQQINGDSNRM